MDDVDGAYEDNATGTTDLPRLPAARDCTILRTAILLAVHSHASAAGAGGAAAPACCSSALVGMLTRARWYAFGMGRPLGPRGRPCTSSLRAAGGDRGG